MKSHRLKMFSGIILCVGVLCCNSVYAQSYAVDVERSKISWQGWKQLFGKPVNQKGYLKLKSGSFNKKDGTFVNASLTMDMNSISHLNDGKLYTDNDVVTHLKSESCFFVEKYPNAIFQLKKVERYSADSSLVTGTLTIKGITKTLSFPASITETKKTLMIKAVFQINRKEFDLDLEPFLIRIGGDKIVRDNIDVAVEIVALPGL